jgi:glycosyltransferase involved in cell wall biosynthesis
LDKNIKVLHIIPDLSQGGAERQLVEIAKSNKAHEICLLSSSDKFYHTEINNIKIYNLKIIKKLPDIRVFYKLMNIIKISQPSIIQCWMYHSCFLLSLLYQFSKLKIPLIWSIRCSDMDVTEYSFKLNLIIKFCRYLSHMPNILIHNSHHGKIIHDNMGFNKNSLVVSNGIDIDKFRPNNDYRITFRKKYNIPINAKVFICAARIDPMKDHNTLLKAFEIVKKSFSNIYLLLAGRGTNKLLKSDKVIALGEINNINRAYCASDYIVSSSAFGEGFSNALGEGMATGLIPISTKVGDAAYIMQNIGKLVNIKNINEMAKSMIWSLQLNQEVAETISKEAIKRIRNDFSTNKMVQEYFNIYNKLN